MFQIHAVPAFNDNYFWLFQPDEQKPLAYIIDTGAAAPVIHALNTYGLTLAGVLLTHHHHDHIDGALELGSTFNIPIYGPKSAKMPQVTHFVNDGDTLKLGSLHAKVMAIPGHTRDHIGYFINFENSPRIAPPLLFCGDTLFAGGCGRLFDGTAEQLFQSLQDIAQLPNDTLIYCAHEYTLENLRFALHIEPSNADTLARRTSAIQKRKDNLPTIPNSLAMEKQTNPFLRCHLGEVHQRVEELSHQKLLTERDVFIQMRRLKDQF